MVNFVVIGKDALIQIEHPVAWFQPWMAWVADVVGLLALELFSGGTSGSCIPISRPARVAGCC